MSRSPAGITAGASGRQPLWDLLGWQPTGEQEHQLEQLQEQLRVWNGRLNLTRLVEGDDYWIAQVFDSLWPLAKLLREAPDADPLQPRLHLMDVGTGCGFPGLALAIALPTARVTLVDSVGRKVEAVRAMAVELGLGDRVDLITDRVERTGQDPGHRGRYDWAMARAVASAPVVAEYLAPLLKPHGTALLYRGQWNTMDQQQLERACEPLRLRVQAVVRATLPQDRGERHAVFLSPAGPCPRLYPRPVGVPARQPLGSP